MKRISKCDIALSIIAILCFILSLLGFIVFPIVYPTLVENFLVLSQNEKDGSLGYSAFLFANPPLRNEMKFYLFNVTNPDEVTYEGAAPRVLQIGPYTFIETEHKKYLNFSSDGKALFYQNFKTWVFNESLSCKTCTYDDVATVPNPSQLGVMSELVDPQYKVTEVAKVIISLGLTAVGAYPFRTVPVGAFLFSGYNDPLLSVAHSNIVAVLSTIFNNGKNIIPIPVPDMRTMAFFNGYNNSRDEEYWVHTGKGDIDRIGEVISWGGQSELPAKWWTTPEARSIRGSDSGSFCKMHLDKDDVLPFFQSYFCRSFDARYSGEDNVEGIPTYTFSVMEDEFDTTLDRNRGFRYRNPEAINYYPEWPSCPDYNSTNCIATPNPVDCSLQENLCNDCCQRGKVQGTYLLPPGIFPLTCYPGRLQPSPFAVLWSAPHFLYSPPVVTSSIVGMQPDEKKHLPIVYDHEPYSGMVTRAFLRMQVSMPLFPVPYIIPNVHVATTLIPLFWEDLQLKMAPFVYDMYWLGFVFAPKFVEVGRAVLLAVAAIIAATMAFLRCRRKD